MKNETLNWASSEEAIKSRWVIPFMLSLSIAVGCAGGSPADAAVAQGGGSSQNAGGDDALLGADGLGGMRAAESSEELAGADDDETAEEVGGSAGEAGAGGRDDSDVPSLTDCRALPRRAVRYSGSVETGEAADCGVWALSILPDGAGNAYVLARAQRDPANPLLSVDATVVLTGPVIASTCTNDPIARHAVFAGRALGPEPFLDTSLTVEYFQSTGNSIVNVVIDTHLAVGSVKCEGPLSLEFP